MNNIYFKLFAWIVIAAILIYAPIMRGAVKIWSITPILVAIGFLVFIWFLVMNNSSDGFRFKRSSIDIPILLFTCLALISLFFSIYKNESIQAVLILFAYIGLYYFILNSFTYEMTKKMFDLIIGMGTILSIYGILQYFGILPHPWWSPKDFLAATYVNHNHFSGYLELVIPITLVMAIDSQKRAPFLAQILWFSLAIMVFAFCLAQSRGAILCLGISLMIMTGIMLRRNLIKVTSVVAIFVFLTCGILSMYFLKPEAFKRLDVVTQINEGEASIKTRLLIWQGTLDMIHEKPGIGTGIGTFAWGFPRFRPQGISARANFAHNDYLQLASEMGVFAIPLMVWLGLSLLWNGFVNKPYDLEALGCCIGLLSLAFHGLIDFNFHIPANMLVCVLFAAYSTH